MWLVRHFSQASRVGEWVGRDGREGIKSGDGHTLRAGGNLARTWRGILQRTLPLSTGTFAHTASGGNGGTSACARHALIRHSRPSGGSGTPRRWRQESGHGSSVIPPARKVRSVAWVPDSSGESGRLRASSHRTTQCACGGLPGALRARSTRLPRCARCDLLLR